MEITHKEIGEATGYSLAKVRKDVQRGKLDCGNIESVSLYYFVSLIENGLPRLAEVVGDAMVGQVSQAINDKGPGKEGDDEDGRKRVGTAGEEGGEGSPDEPGGKAVVGGGDVRDESAAPAVELSDVKPSGVGFGKSIGDFLSNGAKEEAPAEPEPENKPDDGIFPTLSEDEKLKINWLVRIARNSPEKAVDKILKSRAAWERAPLDDEALNEIR